MSIGSSAADVFSSSLATSDDDDDKTVEVSALALAVAGGRANWIGGMLCEGRRVHFADTDRGGLEAGRA